MTFVFFPRMLSFYTFGEAKVQWYILELLIDQGVGLLQVASILWREIIASSVSNNMFIWCCKVTLSWLVQSDSRLFHEIYHFHYLHSLELRKIILLHQALCYFRRKELSILFTSYLKRLFTECPPWGFQLRFPLHF